MVSKSVHRFRLDCVLKLFKNAVFITLTTPDVCTLEQIRLRWRIFRHDYFRYLGGSRKYVMVYEPHPRGHGWHIHLVVDGGYLPIQELRRFSGRAGFGRVHIERVYSFGKVAGYLSKYLAKGIANVKELGVKRVRLVNLSRGLTCLSDIVIKSELSDKIKACMKCDVPELRGFIVLDRYRFILAYILFGIAFHDPIPIFDGILSHWRNL